MLGAETYRNTCSYKLKILPMNQILLSMCFALLRICAYWNALFTRFRQVGM